MQPSIFIVLAFIIYLAFKPKKKMYGNKDVTSSDYIQSQFNIIKDDFSKETLNFIEKIYRLETANFTSGQYKDSLSAGMVYSVDNKISPWNLNGYNVIGFSKNFLVGGKNFRYVAFSDLSEGLRFLGNYIERHNGNGLRWFSTNPTQQQNYADKLNGITPKYV